MAYSEKNYSTSYTFWQDNEEGLTEAAIIVSRVYGGLLISQEGDGVYISGNEINDFCKLLKKAMGEKP